MDIFQCSGDNDRGKREWGKNGGGAGTRTPDTGIMIPLLYQLSYTAPENQRHTILDYGLFVKKNLIL